MAHALRSVALALVVCTSATAAYGQQPAGTFGIEPHALRTVMADAGGTISVVFPVANGSAAPAAVTPTITLPAGWSVVVGGLPFTLAARDSDTWIVSLAVPSRAAAGRYAVSLAASLGGQTVARDSLVVQVRERHALSAALVDAPAYAIAGQAYRLTFLVRNRGNGDARLRLAARTVRGTRPRLETLQLTLGADSSRTVQVVVPTPAVGGRAVDDLTELRVVDVADTASRAVAVARLTLVPKPGTSDELATVPAQLLLRAAQRGSGIAPVELTGGGRLGPRSATEVDFVARGPTGASSPFGDRDEYQLAVRAPDYRLRLGDQLYGYSPLGASGESGFGAGGEVAAGALVAGGYAERARFDRDPMRESGAMVAFRPGGLAGTSQVALDALDRSGGMMPGQVLATTVRFHPPGGAAVSAEYAASRGPLGTGTAAEVQARGDGLLQYDLGHTVASLDFAGPGRGSVHDFALASLPLAADWRVAGSASAHETSAGLFPFDTTGVPLPAHLRTASLSLARTGGLSFAWTAASRRDIVPTPGLEGSQQSITVRGQRSLGAVRLWSTTELGVMHDALADRARPFRDIEVGGALGFGANSVSLYDQVYQGASVLRGPLPMRLLGGSANLHLTRTTSFTVYGSGAVGHALPGPYSLVDARLSQQLPSGATISLRARLASGRANLFGNGRLLFLEYGMPLRVPVGRLHVPGRVQGRIVNGETGDGVAGALVRLGSQAAITDDDGRVSFSGLPAGEYRVSLAQNMALAQDAIDGDATVVVDSTRREPATFRLAVARGAVVEGTVRTLTVARTGVDGRPDSVVDAGPLRDAVVALTSGVDTLYRVTDDAGAFRFGELPARHWTAAVLSTPPAGTRFAPPRAELTLVPGQTAHVDFRATPRHREVHMIDSDDTPLTLPPAGARRPR